MKIVFSEEVAEDIVGRIACGASQADAARAVGVNPRTLQVWLARGRREDAGAYSDFAAAVARARDVREQDLDWPMSLADVRLELERAIRAGSVRAAEIWFREFGKEANDAPALTGIDALDAEDELARKRQGRERGA